MFLFFFNLSIYKLFTLNSDRFKINKNWFKNNFRFPYLVLSMNSDFKISQCFCVPNFNQMDEHGCAYIFMEFSIP